MKRKIMPLELRKFCPLLCFWKGIKKFKVKFYLKFDWHCLSKNVKLNLEKTLEVGKLIWKKILVLIPEYGINFFHLESRLFNHLHFLKLKFTEWIWQKTIWRRKHTYIFQLMNWIGSKKDYIFFFQVIKK